MIRFGKLEIQNFGCIKSAELQLDELGLILLLGENRDTAAADSNGSGKSTVFKALSWCLFGQTVDKIKGLSIIRHGSKRAEVGLNVSVGSDEYLIRRTKGRRKAEALSICYRESGESLGTKTLKEAQEKVEELLGLDWLTFKNTVLYGQGDILHFADPKTTDTQRKAVLSKLLRLEKFDLARKVARSRKAAAGKKLAELSGKIDVLTGQLDRIDVEGLEADSERWEENRAERVSVAKKVVKTAKGALSKAKKQAKKLVDYEQRASDVEMMLADFHEIRERIEELRRDDFELDKDLVALGIEIGSFVKSIKELKEGIWTFEEGGCPTCGAITESDEVRKKVSSMTRDLKKTEMQLTEVEAKREGITKKRRSINEEVRKAQEELAEESDWVEHREMLRDAISRLSLEKKRIPLIEKEIKWLKSEVDRVTEEPNPYTDQIAKATELGAKLSADLEAAEKQVSEHEKVEELADFWIEGFGPSGIQSYLLDSVTPVIEERANRYLEILSDGDLKIKIDTLTTLKDGSVRDKLDVTPTIEGIEGIPPSGGQLKKITLACDLALMDLLAKREGASVDLLLLDEVLDGLDRAGRARVMDLLSYLKHQRSTIIVISHDPEIVEKFSHAMIVVKRGGSSKLEIAE